MNDLRRRHLSPIIVCLGLASCGGSELEESGLVIATDSVEGITRILSAGTAPDWSLNPIVIIGSEAGMGEPADDEFGRISSLTISPAGDLWVADQMNSHVKVFSLDGQLKRTIGREGQGPGEFLSLYSLAWVGDLLLALDFRIGRIGEIDADGAWLGQRPAPGRVSGPVTMLRLYQVGSDETYAWSLNPERREAMEVFIRHGSTGVEEEIPQARRPDQPSSSIQCTRPDGGISFFDIPFAPKFLWHPAPGNLIAVAWTSAYRVAFVTAAGDTVRIVERDYQPVRLETAEWEDELQPFQAFREEWTGEACQPRTLSKPAAKPAMDELLIDVVGRMWVETSSPDGAHWEIFDRGGALIGSLSSFDRSRRTVPYLSEQLIAYVVEDSLGVQRISVAEIQR